MPALPGVYQMLGKEGEILYVGKARNLKKRVASYFRSKLDSVKTQSLMGHAKSIGITITRTDNEALLLEATLIKEHHPRYNILWRDDKSYPYLVLNNQNDFPRLSYYRGTKDDKARYFGPYPSAGSVHETLNLITRIFKLRSCEDAVFAHRSRPCLQYQIQRCTAPCVGFVDKESYAQQVQDAVLFLEGKDHEVMQKIADRMDLAAQAQDYELAAYYRDQIVQLRKIQAQQCVVGESVDTDVLAIHIHRQQAAIAILFIRQGRLLGHKIFFLKLALDEDPSELLSSFIPQYYLEAARRESLPKMIVVAEKLSDKVWIENALAEHFQHKLPIISANRKLHRDWVKMAEVNAKHSLTQQLLEKQSVLNQLHSLQEALNLTEPLERIECFDVSHFQGEACIASCVVYAPSGALRSNYRRYSIKDINGGDDYAALRQVLMRRYEKKIQEGALLPNLILIDGGKGQLGIAEDVLTELQLSHIPLLAVAKGPTRKAGFEQLFLRGARRLELSADSAALHLIQFIRDEAHRFAITAHRQRRAKTRQQSILESVPGIGAQRRRQLLRHFGGLQQLKSAGVSEISQVPGISLSVAEKIYKLLSGS